MRKYLVMRKLVPSSTRSNSTSSISVRMSLSPQPRLSSAASLLRIRCSRRLDLLGRCRDSK